MQVVEKATIAPACCKICSHTDGPFIDTFRTLDGPVGHPGFGRVYVCRSCVWTFAREFGLFDEERASVEEELAATREELEAIKEDLDIQTAAKELHALLEERLPKRRPGRPRKTTKKAS